MASLWGDLFSLWGSAWQQWGVGLSHTCLISRRKDACAVSVRSSCCDNMVTMQQLPTLLWDADVGCARDAPGSACGNIGGLGSFPMGNGIGNTLSAGNWSMGAGLLQHSIHSPASIPSIGAEMTTGRFLLQLTCWRSRTFAKGLDPFEQAGGFPSSIVSVPLQWMGTPQHWAVLSGSQGCPPSSPA